VSKTIFDDALEPDYGGFDQAGGLRLLLFEYLIGDSL
jgi:hypothetical protein